MFVLLKILPFHISPVSHLLFISTTMQVIILNKVPHPDTDIQSSCPIYLTISLKSKNVEDSAVIINWGPGCQHQPQWIGLYDKDPSIFNDPPKVFVETNRNQSGTVETNVKIGRLKLPNGWNRDDVLQEPPKRNDGKCLPFYVTSSDGMKLRSMDCLKIQPNWMNMQSHLMDVPLKNIFLPGQNNKSCLMFMWYDAMYDFFLFKEPTVQVVSLTSQLCGIL